VSYKLHKIALAAGAQSCKSSLSLGELTTPPDPAPFDALGDLRPQNLLPQEQIIVSATEQCQQQP